MGLVVDGYGDFGDLCRVEPIDAKPKLLLIDDQEDIHRLVTARLRHEQVEVVVSSSGAEGLALAKSQRPSAILLDLDMPGMDGFAVLRALKAEPLTTNIPVVIFSANSEADDKVMAFDLGAADFVRKSLDSSSDVAELKARLRAVLRLERLLRLLADRAEVDGLTGLGNRVQFDRRWKQEYSEHVRYGHPLTLLILDLDHFKKINDTYGHPAGDEVLQEFGRIVQSCSRTSDIACRFGGEEFVMILPNTNSQDAMVVADRVRLTLGKTLFPRHPEHSVTCSVGLAGTPLPGTMVSAEQWVEAADKALYAAKHGGRNRVVVGQAGPAAPPVAKAG